jgi:hypothetical protein
VASEEVAMMWHKWTKKSFIDVMKLGCAVLLTTAPWIFGLDGGNIATWNAWLNGSVIALIAVAALVYEAEWEPETTLGVGLWVALSPYIIGFMQDATATLVHVLVGLATAALAVAKLLVGSGLKRAGSAFSFASFGPMADMANRSDRRAPRRDDNTPVILRERRPITKELWKRETLADWLNLALGAWLFLTPSIFSFTSEAAATWNAWLGGIAIGAIAIMALVAFAEWEEWINLALGLWVAASAWIVGFASHATAIRLHVLVGIAVAVLSAARLWSMHRSPPRVAA